MTRPDDYGVQRWSLPPPKTRYVPVPVPYPVYAPPPPAPRANGMGVASLTLGLLGLLFSFVPMVGVIAWPLTILGVIFGIPGLARSERGTAIAGLICSGIGLCVCIVWAVLFFAIVGAGSA